MYEFYIASIGYVKKRKKWPPAAITFERRCSANTGTTGKQDPRESRAHGVSREWAGDVNHGRWKNCAISLGSFQLRAKFVRPRLPSGIGEPREKVWRVQGNYTAILGRGER